MVSAMAKKKVKDRIQLVIFDLDGTLFNAYPAIAKSFNFAMKKMGYPRIGHNTICRKVGWGEQNLIKPFVAEKDLERTLSIYRRHHKEAIKRGTRLLPGAKRLLLSLHHRGYKIAVASNRSTRSSRLIIKHLKIGDRFDYVLCGDKVKKAKPYPNILNQILKQFSLRPQQALYVGDMTIDVQTGKSAKIKTVAVVTGSSTKKEIERLRPFKVISHISSLNEIIDQLNGKSHNLSKNF